MYFLGFSADAEGCETGELRLVGGVAGSSSGVVEVCVNGVWGTFCDYRNEWSHENTVVVCRQLNLQTSSNKQLIHYHFEYSAFFRCHSTAIICV